MVKEIKMYECEICKETFPDKKEAEKCEEKGNPILLPIGTIFQIHKDDGMIFAIIKQFPNYYPHSHSYSTWACRDPKSNDTVGNNYCGFESWDKMYPPLKNIPAYNRMVNFLKDANITPNDYIEDSN